VLGRNGRGLADALRLEGEVDIHMGTLSKALGGAGGYIAGSRRLIELLVNRARSFIYTTALPPPVVAAVDAALDVIAREPERRARLAELSATLRARLRELDFEIPPGEGPIIPVIAGSSERALAWSRGLLERGVFVQAIRPPTVPDGTARLRVTLMATHTDADLEHAVAAFAALRDRL